MIDTQHLINEVLISHYEEIDSTLLNIMAAGVSESEIRERIIFIAPKIEVNNNNVVNVTSYLSFKMPLFKEAK